MQIGDKYWVRTPTGNDYEVEIVSFPGNNIYGEKLVNCKRPGQSDSHALWEFASHLYRKEKMFVKITKGSGGAWWKHRIGEVFQVREANQGELMFKDTHYVLVNKIPEVPNAFAISKDSCVLISDGMTNKQASGLLSKEE